MVIDILKKWMPTYIAELERQIGWSRKPIPSPRSWTTRTRFTHYPEDQLPQCIVVSPGLADPPKKSDGGMFTAEWSVGVGVIVSAKDEASTKALARFYAACVRAIMIQHQSLDNKANGVIWYDESYDDIEDEEDTARNLCAGTGYYRVRVEDVVTWPGGPRTPMSPIPSGDDNPGESRWPDPDPVGQPGIDYPVVESYTVTLNREAL